MYWRKYLQKIRISQLWISFLFCFISHPVLNGKNKTSSVSNLSLPAELISIAMCSNEQWWRGRGSGGEGRGLRKITSTEWRGKGNCENIDRGKEFLKWKLKRGKVMNWIGSTVYSATKLGLITDVDVTQKRINSPRLDRRVSDFSSLTKPVVINNLG